MSSEEDATQTETLIGWVRAFGRWLSRFAARTHACSVVLLQADVQEILHDFIVPNTPRLAQAATWDAAMEATAAAFCSRRLLVVTGEDGALLPQVSADMTLLEAVTSGFLSVGGDLHTLTPRSRGAEADEGDAYERGVVPAPGRAVHRLALFADGKIRSIVSQSDVMRYLYATSERLGPLARETVDALGFVAPAKKVLCVTPATPAFAAFNVMYANALSAVGIVDPETEALVGTLSASDVRRLQAHTFNTLVLPVRDFLLAQAPAAQQDLRPPLAVSPAAPFLRVLELLGGSPRIHRVYVTDARGRPVGVVRYCLLASLRALLTRPLADHAHRRAPIPGCEGVLSRVAAHHDRPARRKCQHSNTAHTCLVALRSSRGTVRAALRPSALARLPRRRLAYLPVRLLSHSATPPCSVDMEAAPFTFAPGAAPPLDLSLDDIIKQRKKDDSKKQKPGAKATPGKKGKPQAAVRAAPRVALAALALAACCRLARQTVLRHAAPPARRAAPLVASLTPAARCPGGQEGHPAGPGGEGPSQAPGEWPRQNWEGAHGVPQRLRRSVSRAAASRTRSPCLPAHPRPPRSIGRSLPRAVWAAAVAAQPYGNVALTVLRRRCLPRSAA